MAKPLKMTSPVVFIILLCLAKSAWPNDEPLTYDRINLSATASTQVDNDTLIASLYYQKEGVSLADISHEINVKITAAVKAVKKYPNVNIQTSGYQSNPVYQKQRLTGWRVRQSIRLESQDISQLSKLIGDLQNTLALESIRYRVSPEALQAAEEGLMIQALDSFKKRSLMITHQFGRTTYRLVTMNVSTGGAPVRPMRIQAMAMGTAPPTIEPGKQDVVVNINGTIEMQLN